MSEIQPLVFWQSSYTYKYFTLETKSEQLNLISSIIVQVIWYSLITFRYPRWYIFHLQDIHFLDLANTSICDVLVCTLEGLAWGKNTCLVSILALTLLYFASISEVGEAFWKKSLSSHYIVSICQKLKVLYVMYS